MGDVVDITSKLPHMSGKCQCLHCKHKWVGVAPIGTLSLECPECGLNKGVFSGVSATENLFMCECSSLHFVLSVDVGGAICSNCGLIHDIIESDY